MRFGRQLHRLQIPQWAPFYFNYNAYKRRVKTALQSDLVDQAKGQCLEIVQALESEAGAVESFFTERYDRMLGAETALSCQRDAAHFGTGTLQLNQADERDLQDLLGAYVELRVDIGRLQWYAKVNIDGLHRMLGKIPAQHFVDVQIWETMNRRLSELEGLTRRQFFGILARVNLSISELNIAISESPAQKVHASLDLSRHLGDYYPTQFLRSLYRTICEDDDASLDRLLSQSASTGPEPSGADIERLMFASSLCAVSYHAKLCTKLLLGRLGRRSNDMLVDGTILHCLVKRMGRRVMTITGGLTTAPASENAELTDHLKYLLEHLQPSQRDYLYEKDSLGRLPIHYAAHHGLFDICGLLMEYMSRDDWFHPLTADSTGGILLPDSEGCTPLHLAVIGRHVEVTRKLVDHLKTQENSEDATGSASLGSKLGNVVAIALDSECNDLVECLLDFSTDLKYRHGLGETLLYIAARSAHEKCVSQLLGVQSCRIEYIDAPESTYGRTPLAIASIHGNLAAVQLLLQAGANRLGHDCFGWTAGELAAYRGHIPVARELLRSEGDEIGHLANQSSTGNGISSVQSTGLSIKRGSSIASSSASANTGDSRNKTQVYINLGSLDSKVPRPAVDLGGYNILNHFFIEPLIGFSLNLSLVGGTGSSYLVHLPVLEDRTNKPWHFQLEDSNETKLLVEVLIGDACLGAGIAMLHCLQGLGDERESLVRDYTIPILERNSSKLMGTVTVTVLVVKPFQHSSLAPPVSRNFLRDIDATQLIGHRGLGQNVAGRGRLQIGENTLSSFLTAMDLGASCVELDVQLTKDHIPVIYHDFLVSETGTDIPMHALSFEQFMNASQCQFPHGNHIASTKSAQKSGDDHGKRQRRRALSSSSVNDELRLQDFNDRMRVTLDLKLKSFKGNTRGPFIQESFVTLEDLLLKLPERIPLNMEIKYPMLWETADWEMDTYSIELNTFLDVILNTVYKLGRSRIVVFSSFSPEMCIALSTKQQDYPVLFLNDAGLFPTGDLRASNVQEAVQFSRMWQLDGVVLASDPLVLYPRLINFVKNHGLICASYGALNNDPKSAKVQAEAGLDALIADDVHLISKSVGGGALNR